uniref:SpoVT-AbrB domain-containing protein n=1 Tax=Candidatus Kentrum sp. MB TaxID=2138164 RepID=A0A450XCI2_9GAMM|nr:MAG: hypothetical protein BECKMB1821G_GA0114241_102442 [Candidatus Kentron sp. MB]VFK31234.1 MAG: hypothetical protein BECKMB1821I_GA0114274_102141 [Candidatus Kentron sp. MB]VFK75408.1 MAG: hypothetical protein BECKMB1821H_GA0114242_102142 [Candidatus Kentron sp. MB]
MHAIELKTTIDAKGNIHLPEQYREAYGKTALLRLQFPEPPKTKQTQRRLGGAKGILEILCEDDEHLEDFREYMP